MHLQSAHSTLIMTYTTIRAAHPDMESVLCPLNSSPLTEGEGAKVAVDDAQQLLGTRQPQRHMPHIKVLHVVAALQVLPHIPLA
jgi:hypothetical protein